MNRKSLGLSLAAAVLTVLVTLPAQAACSKNLTFQRGASSAVIQGAVSGYATCDYRFRARKDQRLTVTVDSGNVQTHLVRPVEEMLVSGEPFTLPASGAYVLRVGSSRTQARQERAEAYKITVGIQ